MNDNSDLIFSKEAIERLSENVKKACENLSNAMKEIDWNSVGFAEVNRITKELEITKKALSLSCRMVERYIDCPKCPTNSGNCNVWRCQKTIEEYFMKKAGEENDTN